MSLRGSFKRHLAAILTLALVCSLNSCTGCNPRKGPGAGKRFASYPSLVDRPRTYNWLVVKCQLSDAGTIPAGLDTSIQQFFTLSGSGFGNIVDYFHDVSYNNAYVVGSNIVGWIPAPYTTANVTGISRTQRTIQCLQAIPAGGPDL